MNNFRMEVQTNASGVPWQHDFEVASPQMARKYCRSHTVQWASVPWFMRMLLWQRTTDVPEGWTLIARYEVTVDVKAEEFLEQTG